MCKDLCSVGVIECAPISALYLSTKCVATGVYNTSVW